MALKQFAMWLCCQAEVRKVAKELQVRPLPVVPFYLKRTMHGAFHPMLKCVFLNMHERQVNKATRKDVKVLARHEMRHYWQSIHYREVCDWWMNHQDAYKRHYFEPICWPEEDARRFASGLSVNAPELTTAQLEALYQNGEL